MLDAEIEDTAARLITLLSKKGRKVSTAESCTGGLLAGAITSISGSSAVFDQGFVTYSNAAKHELLAVPQRLLDTFGAVSSEVAEAMARGLRARTQADYSISVTGIAGPGGGTDAKPVGLVYFGIATAASVAIFQQHFGALDRAAVRRASVLFALAAVTRSVEADC